MLPFYVFRKDIGSVLILMVKIPPRLVEQIFNRVRPKARGDDDDSEEDFQKAKSKSVRRSYGLT